MNFNWKNHDHRVLRFQRYFSSGLQVTHSNNYSGCLCCYALVFNTSLSGQQMMLARVVILLYKSLYKSWQKIRSYDPVAVKTYTNHLTGPCLDCSVSRQWWNIKGSHISSENKVYFTKILRARTKTASLQTSCLCQTKRNHQWRVKINVLRLMENVLFSS